MMSAPAVLSARQSGVFAPAAGRPRRAVRLPAIMDQQQQSVAHGAAAAGAKLLGTAAAAAVLLTGGAALAREKVG